MRGLISRAGIGLRAAEGSPPPPRFQTAALTIVRNEQDIVEPFLRHHAALLDLIVLIDHRSSDRTREVALATARELGNIVVTGVSDRANVQKRTMTAALRAVTQAAAPDFVFLLDADEFLGVASRDELEAALAAVPEGEVGRLKWQTWMPDPRTPEALEPDPLVRMRFRRREEGTSYAKVVLRSARADMPEAAVRQGNHGIRLGKGPDLPKTRLSGLRLRHFPLRSVEQLAAKSVIGWRSHLLRKDFRLDGQSSFHLKRLHDMVASGIMPDARLLADEAARFAQRSGEAADFASNSTRRAHGISTLRRYSDGSFRPAAELIAEADRDCSEAGFDLPGWEAGTSTFLLDEPMIRAVRDLVAPERVLEVGCAAGFNLCLLRHLGVARVLGVDSRPRETTVLDAADYVEGGLDRLPASEEGFDLVLCLGAEETLAPGPAAAIARQAKGAILFSLGTGDGSGIRRRMAEALDLWADCGWYPRLAATLGLRTVASLQPFRQSLLLLSRQHEPGAVERLADLAARPLRWTGATAGHRRLPFGDVPAPADEGPRPAAAPAGQPASL